MKYNYLVKIANDYLTKCSKIKKMHGKYKVLSKKNKNLGVFKTKEQAVKRLKQVEYFKHLDKNNAKDKVIDLTDADDFVFSAITRKMRKQATEDQLKFYFKTYKTEFDKLILKNEKSADIKALKATILKCSKKFKIKISKNIIKNANLSELGTSREVANYMTNIIYFVLTKISKEKRNKSKENLARKFRSLKPEDLSNKKMPASAAVGQCITFVKHVLFNQDSRYIKEILQIIAQNLNSVDLSNANDIVSNVRNYKFDNLDSILDQAQRGSFAPYISETRQFPQDEVYNTINDQEDTRQGKALKTNQKPGSFPLIGESDNVAALRGAGPMENVGIYF